MSHNNGWQDAPLAHLTHFIVSTHHAYLNRELPLISELLYADTRRHWRKHPELLTAHALLAEARALVEQHLIKEETAGFPLIDAHAEDPARSLAPFAGSIAGHIEEHAKVTALFARLRGLLWDYHVPDDLDAEVGLTCARLQTLEQDLAEHIRLENEVLFPRVQKLA